MREFIISLAKNFAKSYTQTIEIQNQVDKNISISIKELLLIGLKIYEFITNWFKPDFKNSTNFRSLKKSKIENNLLKKIKINENEVGYIQNQIPNQSLKLRIMNLLASQFDASIFINSKLGNKLMLNFKI